MAKITLNVNVAVALKIVVVVGAISAIFFRDLTLIFTEALMNGTASYVLTIPLIFTYLVYRKRKMLEAVVPLKGKERPQNIRHLPLIGGILITTIAVLLFWYGSHTFTPLEYHMFTLPLFAAGLCLILFNAQTLRHLVFPVAFLFFLMPPPSQMLSMLVVIIFGTFIAYAARTELWKKIVLLTVGIPIIYVFDGVRSTVMLFIDHYYSNGLAPQMFRLLSDWILLFVGAILLLVIPEIAFKTHIFTKPTEKCLQCNSELLRDQDYCRGCGRILRHAKAKLDKSDIGKLAAIILVAGLLLTIHTPVFAFTQGPPIVAISTPSGQQVSAQILPQTDQYTLTFLPNSGSETQANLDMSFGYLYAPLNQSIEPVLASIEIAPTQSYLHPWEEDLVAPEVSQIDLQNMSLTRNPQIICRYFVFNYAATNQTQAVLYWFETTAFMVNLTSQEKHVEISLIAYPQSIDQSVLAKVELQLVTLATAIANYWQQIKTWSQITLFIAQKGITLSTATAITLCLTIIYYEVEAGKRRKASLVASGKLASPSREIVRAVQETKKPATLENVAVTLRKSVAQRMTTEQLRQRLAELEKRGIIRSSVYSLDDGPLQTWKT